MTIEEPPREHVGPLRQFGRIVSWVFGLLFALIGGVGLIGKSDTGNLAIGLGMVAAGAVLLPPVSRQIRNQVPRLRPIWAPPLAALALFLVTAIVGGSLIPKTPEQVRAEQKASAEAKAKADAEFAAKDRVERQAKIDRYIARLGVEIQPTVEAVSASKPKDLTAVTEALDTFDKAAKVLEEGKDYVADPAALAAMQRLRKALAAKQQSTLPLLRTGYGAVMDSRLWEDNVDVFVQGPGNRRIRFVGVWFAANRNIASVQGEARETLQRLRFARSQYEWYRGSEYSYYDLETPTDSAIGYWSGMSFTAVPPPPGSSRTRPK